MSLNFIKGDTELDGRAPIIAVHGAGGASSAWLAQRREVGGAWPFLAVDLPGHGGSPGPSCDTIAGYLDSVIGFMDEQGIESAILAGHSMGGAISQLAALEAPGRVAGLMLVGTGAKLSVVEQIFVLIKGDMEQFLMLFGRFAFGPNAGDGVIKPAMDVMRSTPVKTLLDDFIACNRFDERARTALIKAPTLVVSSEHDLLTPPDYGEWLAKKIEGARFELVPGVGHMIQIEAHRRLSDLILSFARGLG